MPFNCIKADEGENPILKVALTYLNRPYASHTLDGAAEEQLVVNTQKVDCTTYVEYVLAEVMEKKNGLPFKENLKRIRYRNGKIEGYCSRLHYIADWIENGTKSRLFEDISKKNTADSLPIRLNYMSSHPSAYPQLASSGKNRALIKQQEERLNRGYFHYLPKEKLTERGPEWIKDGDILAITTSIAGLDVSHLGFAIRINGKLHLLNASSAGKKVEISKEPIIRLMQKHKRWTGLRVLRVS